MLAHHNVLLVMAYCYLFSVAPQPKACVDDFAYWSQDPKLVEVWREEKTSLGLSIMTREVGNIEHYSFN